jgi:hypothetical protein
MNAGSREAGARPELDTALKELRPGGCSYRLGSSTGWGVGRHG